MSHSSGWTSLLVHTNASSFLAQAIFVLLLCLVSPTARLLHKSPMIKVREILNILNGAAMCTTHQRFNWAYYQGGGQVFSSYNVSMPVDDDQHFGLNIVTRFCPVVQTSSSNYSRTRIELLHRIHQPRPQNVFLLQCAQALV